MARLWAVHIGTIGRGGMMWPNHFKDVDSLQKEWDEFSTREECEQFPTLLEHLDTAMKNWRETADTPAGLSAATAPNTCLKS